MKEIGYVEHYFGPFQCWQTNLISFVFRLSWAGHWIFFKIFFLNHLISRCHSLNHRMRIFFLSNCICQAVSLHFQFNKSRSCESGGKIMNIRRFVWMYRKQIDEMLKKSDQRSKSDWLNDSSFYAHTNVWIASITSASIRLVLKKEEI